MEWLVSNQGNGLPLSEYIRRCVDDVPQRVIREMIQKRDIKIDGTRIQGDVPLQEGQTLTLYWPRSYLLTLMSPDMLPAVVYEDTHVVILDKPAGLLSQSESLYSIGNNALDLMRKELKRRGEPAEELVLCHRLDVMTGGLLVFAKDSESAEILLSAFENRTIEKTYVCDVKGCPSQRSAVLDAWLRKDEKAALVSVTDYPARGAVPIRTGYTCLSPGPYARLQVQLYTGKTHQIRAHLAHIGHPILGDDKYGDRDLNRKLGIRHQRLWSTRLIFHTEGCLSGLNGKIIETAYPYDIPGKERYGSHD